MTYRLEDFPLRFDNAKSLAVHEKIGNTVGVILLTLTVGMCLFLSALVVFGHEKGAPTWGVVLGAILPWVLAGGIFGPAFFNKTTDTSGLIPTEKSTLVLDDQGVHVTIGQHVRDYPWARIASANVMDTNPRGESKVHLRAVHIRLMGQFDVDPYADWIDGSFDINVDELHALIQQGMKRWGSPIPADQSA